MKNHKCCGNKTARIYSKLKTSIVFQSTQTKVLNFLNLAAAAALIFYSSFSNVILDVILSLDYSLLGLALFDLHKIYDKMRA